MKKYVIDQVKLNEQCFDIVREIDVEERILRVTIHYDEDTGNELRRDVHSQLISTVDGKEVKVCYNAKLYDSYEEAAQFIKEKNERTIEWQEEYIANLSKELERLKQYQDSNLEIIVDNARSSWVTSTWC